MKMKWGEAKGEAGMSDTIQIPRAVAVAMRDALRGVVDAADDDCGEPNCDECNTVRPMRKAVRVLGDALREAQR